MLKKPTVVALGLSFFFSCHELLAFFKHLPLLSLQQKVTGALLHPPLGWAVKMNRKKQILKSGALAALLVCFLFRASNSLLGRLCPERVKHKEFPSQALR